MVTDLKAIIRGYADVRGLPVLGFSRGKGPIGHVFIHIHYKELAHMFVETDRSQVGWQAADSGELRGSSSLNFNLKA